MWCPNCKNEYVEGITHCTDCGAPLVAELPTADEWKADETFVPDDTVEAFNPSAIPEDDEAETLIPEEASPADSAHAYVSKASQAEDMRSTAYTFTLVGGGGLILLILVAAGVIPFSLGASTKVMLYIVMGIMFLIFLGVGIRSFSKIRGLVAASAAEDALFAEVTDWFRSNFCAADIDASLDTAQPEETLYFARYDAMKKHITAHRQDIEASLLDHIIETLYSDIF